jgi:16S rRNA (cytosine967-C5)-methyltransferase
MSVDPVRDAAIDVLLRVVEKGAFIDVAVDKTLRRKTDLSERGRRFLTRLCYGTVRNRNLADHVLKGLLNQPIEKLPVPIRLIMEMGVYQALFCDSVTFPAMVHTAVDLAKRKGHVGTARLTNAVLKKVPETLDAVVFPDKEVDLARFCAVRYSLPRWLVTSWITDFGPETAEEMAKACASEAPMCIRVNSRMTSRKELAHDLGRAGCIVAPKTKVPDELTYIEGKNPLKTKSFQGGQFMIQDAASMLPAHLLDPQPGEKVIDMCAAPGTKTTHLGQLSNDEADIIAMDIHPWKMRLVEENCERLDLNSIRTVVADANTPPLQNEFDAVLLDAPCSGLGTMRRHPDLKWRTKRSDPEEMAQIQLELLRSALKLCKIGGRIVYSVCTFTPTETTAIIETIQRECAVVLEDGPAWMNPWKITTGQYRTLPSAEGLDGFFLTRLRKAS